MSIPPYRLVHNNGKKKQWKYGPRFRSTAPHLRELYSEGNTTEIDRIAVNTYLTWQELSLGNPSYHRSYREWFTSVPPQNALPYLQATLRYIDRTGENRINPDVDMLRGWIVFEIYTILQDPNGAHFQPPSFK